MFKLFLSFRHLLCDIINHVWWWQMGKPQKSFGSIFYIKKVHASVLPNEVLFNIFQKPIEVVHQFFEAKLSNNLWCCNNVLLEVEHWATWSYLSVLYIQDIKINESHLFTNFVIIKHKKNENYRDSIIWGVKNDKY